MGLCKLAPSIHLAYGAYHSTPSTFSLSCMVRLQWWGQCGLREIADCGGIRNITWRCCWLHPSEYSSTLCEWS